MRKRIIVEGMKCENCARHVKENVIRLEGIINVTVNLSNKEVIFDSSIDISDETINSAINNEKYNVVKIE